MKTISKTLSIAAVCLLSFIMSFVLGTAAYAYVPVNADIAVDCLDIPEKTEHTYNIKIERENESYPAPKFDHIEISENGTGHFEIDITEPGTFTYRLFEVSGDDAEIDYDKNVYIVTVFAENSTDDSLVYSVSANILGKSSKTESIEFKNIVLGSKIMSTTTAPIADSGSYAVTTTASTTTAAAATTASVSSTAPSVNNDNNKNNNSITEFVGSVLTGDSFPAHTVRMIALLAILTAVTSFLLKRKGKEEERDE